MQNTVVEVDGLFFEETPVGLARQLHTFGGIAHVAVDRRAGTVTVAYDESRLSAREVARMICECGYSCPRYVDVYLGGADSWPVSPGSA